MNPILLVKGGASLVAAIGGSRIAGYAVKRVLPTTLTTVEKVVIGAGTFAIGGAVGSAAANYVEEFCDIIIDTGKTFAARLKEEVKKVSPKET